MDSTYRLDYKYNYVTIIQTTTNFDVGCIPD